MLDKICDAKQLTFVVAGLLGAFIALGIGKGLGYLGLALFKKIFGEKGAVTVNVITPDPEHPEENGMTREERTVKAFDRMVVAGHACLIPNNCPKHSEENARSLENKAHIEKLEGMINTNRELFWKELKAARKGITCIINGLLAKQIIDPHDIPKEVD